MRLHHLELAAFGPFAGQQVVDFDELTASGLFLLDGPTGAGKTTVLDAITFALYGPGERNGDGRLRSDFAPREAAPRVRLEFSVRGVRHRVTRSPDFERPKRRGVGTTRQAAQAHLERFEDGRWVSRSSNKAEIADMLAEELGLTRDQFTQVVVLPQGEFARFLRASDDERRALLTKLFGTQLYDRITDELERQGHAAARDLDAALRRLRSCVSAAGEAAGLSAVDRDELCDVDGAVLSSRLDDLGAALAAAQRVAQHASAESQSHSVAAQARSAAAQATLERLERFRAALQRMQEHERDGPTRAADRVRLDAALRAERVRELLDAADEAARAADEATAAVRRLDPDVAPDALTGTSIDDIVARAAQWQRQAAELQHLAVQEEELSALRDDVAAATAAAQLAQAQAQVHRERLALLPEEREQLDAELARARDTIAAGASADAAAPALQAALQAAHRLAALATERANAVAVREQAVAAHQQAVDDHQQAVDARLRGMAAELAQQLVDDVACPVCGATDHPQPAQAEADAMDAADVSAVAARRAAAEVTRSTADADLALVDAEIAAAQAVRGTVPAAELRRALAECRGQVTAAEQAAAREPQLSSRQRELASEERELNALVVAAQSEATAATAALQTLTQRCAAVDAAVTQARGDYPSVGVRQAALRSRADRATELAAAARRRCTAVEQYDTVRARTVRAVTAAGFGDVDVARAALLDPTQLAELHDAVAQAERIGDQLAAALRAEEFAGLESDPSALADELALALASATAAETELDAAAQAAEQAAALAATAAHAAQRFAQAQADVQAARERYEREAAETDAVRYLSKLTRGMAGQRRVALTTFVLRRWFEHVVQAANVRLLMISSGRYELVRVDDADGRVERAGLTLNVIDRHTGESRPTRSLSGGETFYTSLALALGLADVVRAEAGGIDLDTLFIDEGFGSLDAQTLDEVMTVIEDLRDRGRVVGIVSHVADLKELIHERVEVTRLADGSSTLRVVA